ncbi:MAG: sialate O-acetylesterase [Aeoliella sp.]
MKFVDYIRVVRCAAVVLVLGALVENAIGQPRTRTANTDRPVKIFIIAGQSNAKGYNHIKEYNGGHTEFPQALRHQSNILFWFGEEDAQKQANAWSDLRVADSGSFGPEISFAHDLAAAMPNEQIAIIKCAVGGTGIARSVDYSDYILSLQGFKDRGKNWHSPSEGQKGGLLFQWLIKNVHDAQAALDRREAQWELAGCLWMQGEHEAGISRKMAMDYDKLLADFIGAVRRDLKTPSLPFLIGEVNSHNWAYGDLVRSKQAKVCRDDAHAVLVKTTDLSRKGSGGASHFDADGMLELGSRFAKALSSLAGIDKTEHVPPPEHASGGN